MKTRALLGLGIASMLGGCVTPPMSPQQLETYLDRHYAGAPAEQFFFSYGRPAGEFQRYEDGNVYRWASIDPQSLPPERAVTNYVSPHGHYAVVDTYDGVPQSQYCELRIYTDRANNIQHFDVAVDSVGKWSASRCSEIFY